MITATTFGPYSSHDAQADEFPTGFTYTANVPPAAIGPQFGQTQSTGVGPFVLVGALLGTAVLGAIVYIKMRGPAGGLGAVRRRRRRRRRR